MKTAERVRLKRARRSALRELWRDSRPWLYGATAGLGVVLIVTGTFDVDPENSGLTSSGVHLVKLGFAIMLLALAHPALIGIAWTYRRARTEWATRVADAMLREEK